MCQKDSGHRKSAILLVGCPLVAVRKRIWHHQVKTYLDEDAPFRTMNFRKRGSQKTLFAGMKTKYPNGKTISKAKYDDLMSLLPFVPEDYHAFYKSLLYDNTVVDYLENENEEE